MLTEHLERLRKEFGTVIHGRLVDLGNPLNADRAGRQTHGQSSLIASDKEPKRILEWFASGPER
jgi:hypothetical protein